MQRVTASIRPRRTRSACRHHSSPRLSTDSRPIVSRFEFAVGTREVHRSCYAAEVPGVDIKSRANSTPTAAQRFRCSLDYISLLSRKNSLLWLQKFPVPLCREFGGKPLNWLVDWASKS